MKERIRFFLGWGLLWFILFSVSKVIFLLFNFQEVKSLSFLDIGNIFLHGMMMDLSATGYLMIIPCIILTLSILIPVDSFKKIMCGYTVILLTVVALVIVVDAELFKYWGFRLDATPLIYLKTPKEVLANTTPSIIIRQILVMAAMIIIGIFLFRYWIGKHMVLKKINPWNSIVMLLIGSLLTIPIRGGFGVAPMNVGSVYFSKNQFLNLAAINVFYNLGYSLTKSDLDDEQYQFFPEEEVQLNTRLCINDNSVPDNALLNTSRPNVVLLILESFTSKVIEPLGGLPELTPQLNKLSQQGLLFTNFYANGDRSVNGLVSILSGYPAQPIEPIIKFPSKSRLLPRIPTKLSQLGYYTSFYYGGDINFANMRSYLIDSRFDDIISMDSFPESTWNSKWGAHDHVVFDRLYQDIQRMPQPFFNTLFTLSSHEPFEVPHHHIEGDDEQSKFFNSIHYTDHSLGEFIEKCKLLPLWKNTLFIVVADHGHRLPGPSSNSSPDKFKIPMLWFGGALNQTGIIDKYATQMDIASTLLHQMNLSSQEFSFSKDIFSKHQGFAFYVFNNGFSLLEKDENVVFDCNVQQILESSGEQDSTFINTGKSFLQLIHSDMKNKGLHKVKKHTI